MKNEYEIRGDVTIIFIKRRNGEVLEVIVDTADLPKLQKFPNAWTFSQCKDKSRVGYVIGNFPRTGRSRTIPIHRWLMDAQEVYFIDHINHNTLDNRRSCNLRIVTPQENNHNLNGPRRHNTSGYLGVSFHKQTQKWLAYATLNKKRVSLGLHFSPEEAYEAVCKFKSENMPLSKEAREKEGVLV